MPTVMPKPTWCEKKIQYIVPSPNLMRNEVHPPYTSQTYASDIIPESQTTTHETNKDKLLFACV
jgi:hypothetical protein